MMTEPDLGGLKPRLSCIIPAFNEGPRIGTVLDVVMAHPLIDEIIVVDDGSTDDTVACVTSRAGVELVRLAANGGKSRAVAAGLARARGSLLLLVDADLIGLGPEDLTSLILPVVDGYADVSISLRGNAPRLWQWIGLDYISGERMLRRELMAGRKHELDRLPRFGLEVWINEICIATLARISVVSWSGVESPLKSRKFGWLRGAIADVSMVADLVRSVGPTRLVRQIIVMRRLRVEPGLLSLKTSKGLPPKSNASGLSQTKET